MSAASKPVRQPLAPKLHHIEAKTQKRLDYLMGRSNEGELTDNERTELERFAVELETLSVKNAELLTQHVRPERGQRKTSPAD